MSTKTTVCHIVLEDLEYSAHVIWTSFMVNFMVDFMLKKRKEKKSSTEKRNMNILQNFSYFVPQNSHSKL